MQLCAPPLTPRRTAFKGERDGSFRLCNGGTDDMLSESGSLGGAVAAPCLAGSASTHQELGGLLHWEDGAARATVKALHNGTRHMASCRLQALPPHSLPERAGIWQACRRPFPPLGPDRGSRIYSSAGLAGFLHLDPAPRLHKSMSYVPSPASSQPTAYFYRFRLRSKLLSLIPSVCPEERASSSSKHHTLPTLTPRGETGATLR